VTSLVRRRPLVAFFVIAYAVSWGLWLPLVASVQGWWRVDVPGWWHYTGAAGPVTAAMIFSSVAGGTRGVRGLLNQYSPRRAPLGWLAFVVVSVLAAAGVGVVLTRIVDGAWPSSSSLWRTDNLPDLGLPLTLAAHVLTFGLGEETGWRGFALPRLQSRFSAIRAAEVLLPFWALWHLPTFFENPSFMDFSAFQVVGWLAGLWMGSIFLAWLYNSSRGSLLVVVVWHGLFNLFSASEAGDWVPVVLSVSVVGTAFAAIRLAGPEELTGLKESPGNRRQRFGEG